MSGEKLAVAGASVGAVTPSQVMGQLLAGPTGLSAHQGMTTQIPAGTVLNRLQVSGDTATVDLSETFASGGGSLSMMLRAAEVTYTLTQFPGITKVDLLLDGAKVAGLGGEGLIATGWQRSTFEDVTPAVLVETPVPGAIVTSPLTLAGTANTFEATVNYTLTDGDGKVLVESSTTATTATSGTGTRGTFTTSVPFRTSAHEVRLQVYEVSAKDGSRIHLVDIPLAAGHP